MQVPPSCFLGAACTQNALLTDTTHAHAHTENHVAYKLCKKRLDLGDDWVYGLPLDTSEFPAKYKLGVGITLPLLIDWRVHQRQSACLACMKPWVQFPGLKHLSHGLFNSAVSPAPMSALFDTTKKRLTKLCFVGFVFLVCLNHNVVPSWLDTNIKQSMQRDRYFRAKVP